MFSHRTWLVTGAGFLVILVALTVTAGGIWFHQDRTGMLHTLCEAGLPNLSRPAVVRPNDLGCNILGPKRRVKGVLRTGFESSNFITDQLGRAPRGGGFTGSTWLTLNQTGTRDAQLDSAIDASAKATCGAGMVTIVADGWPTVTAGHYGHLGAYAREFYVDRILAVGAPPDSLIRDWNEGLRRARISKEWCQEQAKFGS
jgi:hypothetical protein